MRNSTEWLPRQNICSFVLVLASTFGEAAAVAQQQPEASPQPQSTHSVQNHSQDSDIRSLKPDENPHQSESAPPDGPALRLLDSADSSEQSGSVAQEGEPAKPVGTAAAPYEKPSGFTASRPAGAVIAPGKQRRARTILIRVGVVVGAAVAVGTVVAVSRASPSRPN